MWPVVEMWIRPKSPADSEKLSRALSKLCAEDSSLSFDEVSETGQTVLRGTSEAQLDASIKVLNSTYDVRAEFGRTQAFYVETIAHPIKTRYIYATQAGGSGQYADVALAFAPVERGAGIVFESRLAAGALPAEYVSAVESGVRLQAKTGVSAGFPTLGFKFTLTDAKYHDADSSALAFNIAAKACFRELGKTNSVTILEPLMKVDVTTPAIYAKKVEAELRNRTNEIATIEARGNDAVVTTFVPFAATHGCADALNVLSNGSAKLSMTYETHREVTVSHPPDDRFPPAMALRA